MVSRLILSAIIFNAPHLHRLWKWNFTRLTGILKIVVDLLFRCNISINKNTLFDDCPWFQWTIKEIYGPVTTYLCRGVTPLARLSARPPPFQPSLVTLVSEVDQSPWVVVASISPWKETVLHHLNKFRIFCIVDGHLSSGKMWFLC